MPSLHFNRIAGHHEHPHYVRFRHFWRRLHIDLPLLLGLLLLVGVGLIILYSASNQDVSLLVKQGLHFLLAFGLMIVFAQIPPVKYQHWSFWLFIVGIFLLIAVLLMGKMGKGAQRWLDFGILRFQPSEIIKLALPMMLARYFDDRRLPPHLKDVAFASLLIIVPVILVAKQPDLGTALLLAAMGAIVLLLAGINWGIIMTTIAIIGAALPIAWHFMRDYQRQRVLTFISPERDPLGAGYHIIQSKIALGSGGIFGKGWLNGTQSHLHFLPEHATDFIFAVVGEEFGLMGGIILLSIYLYIMLRCFYISCQAQDTFTRLLAGSITVSFFVSVFVNMGMVSGILPVVGLPLPLISYGGTSFVTTIIGFGILMSIQTHRKLLPS